MAAESETKVDDLTIEHLYYGSTPVCFKQCTGKTFIVNPDIHHFKSLKDETSINTVKDRRSPQSKLGSEYTHLLLPSMPCYDLQITDIQTQSTSNHIPLITTAPLIKTKSNDPAKLSANITAYQSGIRSALLHIDNDANHGWFRLKGCGNNNDGYFPFQCIEDGQSPLIEIRGCCFEHTTLRELKMSSDIQSILCKHSIASCNIPYGYYVYDIDKYCTKIHRTCTIFKTLGNKRFGDHLLLGLLRILPIITDIKNASTETIYNLFTEIRTQNDSDAKFKVMETYLAVLCEIDIVDLKREMDDGKQIAVPLKAKIDRDSDYWNADKQRGSAWNACCDKYNETVSNMKDASAILNGFMIEIWHRLGYESGYIEGVLHRNGISWGTYSDPLGTHCNAHCNNYVILPFCEFKKYEFCLAPLDFDMAFYESEYIQDMSRPKLSFEELLILENNGNRGSLSGDPEISTGVHWKEEKVTRYRYDNVDEMHKMDLIKWALHDTLVASFDVAYASTLKKGAPNRFKWSEERERLMYAIFDLALTATLDVVA